MSDTSDHHPDADLLERFMRGELEQPARRAVVRHMLAGCARCAEVTGRLWALGQETLATPGAPGPGDPAEASGAFHPGSYRGVFERVFDSGRRREEAMAAEREEAPRLGARLLRQPRAKRLVIVCRQERFRTLALAEHLIDKSRLAAQGDPAPAAALEAVETAELAIAIAGRLDRQLCGRSVVKDLEARAWACLSDARRLCGDLEGAERALATAEALQKAVPGSASPWADLLRKRAALAEAKGDLETAGQHLDRALESYRAMGGVGGQDHAVAQALIQKGLMVGRTAGPQAIALLQEGAALLDEHLDPRLLASALLGLAALLCEADRAAEAMAVASDLRPLLAKLGDRLGLVRLRWLEGRIESASEPETAERALLEARADLLAAGLGREAALVSLDLAILFARHDRWREIKVLSQEMLPIFSARDMRREAMAALLVFRRAVESESATLELVDELARFLRGTLRKRRDRLTQGARAAGAARAITSPPASSPIPPGQVP
ncbi:MAG TPA: hypothetical protein VOA87_01255 [Thermoanaerobaculia bacterium]|nr:hypothetical protein [Thermoanaerobaculia bacterium]